MLRNLPRSFTRDELVRKLNMMGFEGLYDFVYLPVDFKSRQGKCYGFVNLVSGEHAERLIGNFHGFGHWSRATSRFRRCTASLSHTQGLEANVERYRNSPVMADGVPESFKPAIFAGAQQIPFPTQN